MPPLHQWAFHCFKGADCPIYLSSFRSSKAARTAAITKAEKVQSFPTITASTAAITSLGNRIVLFVVGDWLGILNLLILQRLPQYNLYFYCIAFCFKNMHCKCIALLLCFITRWYHACKRLRRILPLPHRAPVWLHYQCHRKHRGLQLRCGPTFSDRCPKLG